MPQQNWVAPLNTSDVSTGAAGSILSVTGVGAISPSSTTAPDYSFPGGVAYVGMVLRITAQGIWTCGSTATNATFALMVGGTGGTTLCTTGPVAMLTSQTAVAWNLSVLVSFRTVGTAGKVWAQGY